MNCFLIFNSVLLFKNDVLLIVKQLFKRKSTTAYKLRVTVYQAVIYCILA